MAWCSPLGDVLFDFNRAELKPAANRTALKLVQFLQLNPRRVIRIEGYTDSVGDRQANLDLSRERAQAVADVLPPISAWIPRACAGGRLRRSLPVTDNASNRGGRRTAGWRSSSPTTRASSARRAESRCRRSPGTPKGPGLFSPGEPGGAGFSVRTCARAGYHRDRTSSSSNPCSISTLYFVITSREAQ